MELFINDVYNRYNVEKSEANTNAIKAMMIVLKEKELCQENKQKLSIDSDVLDYSFEIFKKMLEHFDPNYNRRSDFIAFCRYVAASKIDGDIINFNSLFCPGYTRYGYKSELGHTTKWKLEELSKIRDLLDKYGIKSNFKNYYSDVFLENTNSKLEPNWKEQMENNRELFHKEGEKYFDKDEVLNASSIPIFNKDSSVVGYIDDQLIKTVKSGTYSAFVKSNRKFYESLNFTEEQMQLRNDRLITMYRELSNYLNTLNNVVFLPMENMYERENIFSENGTCTMYLRLKR